MSRLSATTRALLVSVAVLVLRFPLFMLLEQLPGYETLGVRYGVAMLEEVLEWLLPGLLLWRLNRRDCRTGRAPASPWIMLLALPLAAGAQWFCGVLTAAWENCLPPEASVSAIPLPEDPAGWVLAILAMCAAPALAEELFFRGGLLPAFRQSLGDGGALLASSLLFCLAHGSLAGLWGHFLAGLLLGWVMLRTGRMEWCVALHFGYNLTAVVLTLLSPGGSALLNFLSLAVVAAGSAGLLLFRTEKPPRQAPDPGDALLGAAALVGCLIGFLG